MFAKRVKSICSAVLILSVFLLSFSMSAGAAEETKFSAGSFPEDMLTIPEEVATEIGRLFLKDMKEMPYTAWDDSTEVIATTPLYDTDGEKHTAYCVEFSSGYVIVSAYVDVSSPILEWSDTKRLSCTSRSRSAESKIVYPGVLEYYIDNGGSTLLTEQGQAVLRKDLANTFEKRRSPEHINEEVKTALKESLSDGKRRIGAINTQGGYINDPRAYAKNVYGGTFWGVNWKNTWESYAHFAIMTDFAKNEPNCCPTAITNLIKMYGKKYNKATIKNATDKSVYSKVMAANDGYYNPNGVIEETTGGTGFDKAGSFIRDAFFQYGNNTVDTFDAGQLNYQKTITLFDSPNKLMLIGIPYSETKHPYGSHAVVGYAYNRVCNSAGIYRAFIKISDGINPNPENEGRYVEIDSVAFGGKFWEITF